LAAPPALPRPPAGTAFRRFLPARGGNIATLTALTLPVMLMFAAFAIDEGTLFLERRGLQAAADVAAIEATFDPGGASAAAAAALALNWAGPVAPDPAEATPPAREAGANPTGRAVRLSVEAGVYTPDPEIDAAARFRAGAQPPNAARVRLAATGTRFFAAGFLPQPRITVAATAARMGEATLFIGSRLAALDEGALNATLGALTGSAVSLSLMDYEALARADASLFGVMDALRTDIGGEAATYRDLLDTAVGLGPFIAAAGRAGGLDARAEAALGRLARDLAASGRQLSPGSLLDLGKAGETRFEAGAPGRDPAANALDLVSAAALLAVANGRHQIELGLDAEAAGLAGLSATLAVGEPPQGSPPLRAGMTGATVRTAQTRLLLRLRIAGDGLPAAVQLPVAIDLAPAEARIAAISCPAGGTGGASVTVEARPGLARLAIGEPDMAHFAEMTAAPARSPARLLDAPLVRITGSASAEIASPRFTTLRFSAPEIARGEAKRVSSRRLAGSLTRSLLSDLRLQVSVAGLSLGLGEMTKAALETLLAQSAPAIDAAIDGTLALFGVRVGEADVKVTGAQCGRPVLVQ